MYPRDKSVFSKQVASKIANTLAAMVCDAGVGRHLVYNINKGPHIMVHWAKSLYALEWLYLASVALPKISICLLYLRIFNSRTARISTHVVIWAIVINWVVCLVATSLQCRPFAYQRNKKIRGSKCINQGALYQASSAPDIATDVVILLLPMKTIWNLEVSTAQKWGVLYIFSTGSV
jgi:hypothetical protein